jgi:lysosomal Pro-X carboxypeptidase
MPFGNRSFELDKVGYLTSEQALADYAQNIQYIKDKYDAQSCPVVAFGTFSF